VELSGPILPRADLGRHVMECHRRLAELGGSRAPSFRSIADQLARELGEAPGVGEPPTDEYEVPQHCASETETGSKGSESPVPGGASRCFAGSSPVPSLDGFANSRKTENIARPQNGAKTENRA
jgi:hypothetical protein